MSESFRSSLITSASTQPSVRRGFPMSMEPERARSRLIIHMELQRSPGIVPGKSAFRTGGKMAVNKPTGDNARKGAVKKRSQTKTTLGGASAWTKRNKNSGEFMALKRPGKKKKAAKKFKGVRVERAVAERRKRPQRKSQKSARE